MMDNYFKIRNITDDLNDLSSLKEEHKRYFRSTGRYTMRQLYDAYHAVPEAFMDVVDNHEEVVEELRQKLPQDFIDEVDNYIPPDYGMGLIE